MALATADRRHRPHAASWCSTAATTAACCISCGGGIPINVPYHWVCGRYNDVGRRRAR